MDDEDAQGYDDGGINTVYGFCVEVGCGAGEIERRSSGDRGTGKRGDGLVGCGRRPGKVQISGRWGREWKANISK